MSEVAGGVCFVTGLLLFLAAICFGVLADQALSSGGKVLFWVLSAFAGFGSIAFTLFCVFALIYGPEVKEFLYVIAALCSIGGFVPIGYVSVKKWLRSK